MSSIEQRLTEFARARTLAEYGFAEMAAEILRQLAPSAPHRVTTVVGTTAAGRSAISAGR